MTLLSAFGAMRLAYLVAKNYSQASFLALTILVYASKLRFNGKYSDVLALPTN